MTISYQWLLEYLPEPLPVNELSKILTSIGLEVEAVEAVESVRGGLEGLVIGEVLTCERHPNADKLSVTTVSIGPGEPLHIVCGAPNVAAGQKVVVATVGTTVYPTDGEPFLIKKAKIRGEESAGMICAEDEIGLGKSHAGIMILPENAVVGTPAKTYFNIPETDHAIHIGLTPNRSDANSHIGVARDVCAYLSHHKGGHYTVRMPAGATPGSTAMPVKINIENAGACPRYSGICLTNVKVGESPEWLKQRLNAIGVRSINNIVDVTNYVLHEYGQPLHAFDADQLKGQQISIRFMPEGTPFITLDGKERKLAATDLMICDAEGPIAMAGVFGGLHSGITDGTTNVLIESACFNAMHIRRTSMHHGLRTDAATHFEKGVDINNVIPASLRAALLMAEVAHATIAGSVKDEYPEPVAQHSIHVKYDYVRTLSGKAYSQDNVKTILTALGFTIMEEDAAGLTLLVPGNKPDVLQPADIVEEILRIDGLDNIELTGRMTMALTRPLQNDRHLRRHLSELLCGSGLQEIVTNSIVNSRYYPAETPLVRMINSLSSELDVMRPSMLESGLEVIQYNCNRKNNNLALFEFGNIYTDGGNNNYRQESSLAIWLTGDTHTAHWNQKAVKADLFYLKGIISNLLAYSGISKVQVKQIEGNTVWMWKNELLCTAMQVHTAKLKEFDVKQDVYYASVNWDTWVKATAAGKVVYSEVPKFPAVTRDLALVLDSSISYQSVKDTTEQLKLKELQSFGLFDVFESDKLGAGKKSLALTYTFQVQDRTLTDAEIEHLMKQLMDSYKAKLNAQIRE